MRQNIRVGKKSWQSVRPTINGRVAIPIPKCRIFFILQSPNITCSKVWDILEQLGIICFVLITIKYLFQEVTMGTVQ